MINYLYPLNREKLTMVAQQQVCRACVQYINSALMDYEGYLMLSPSDVKEQDIGQLPDYCDQVRHKLSPIILRFTEVDVSKLSKLSELLKHHSDWRVDYDQLVESLGQH
jgi:hypothetical protein